jgi:hypothetical protein
MKQSQPDWASRRVAKALAGQYVSLSPKIMAKLLRAERAACLRRCRDVQVPTSLRDQPSLAGAYFSAVRDCAAAIRSGANGNDGKC